MSLCLKCNKEKYIKARGLCSCCYRKHGEEFAKTTRTWTSSDIAVLKRHYKPLDPLEPLETKIIAKMLKCRNSDIRLLAMRSGLMSSPDIQKLDRLCRQRVRYHHKQGYSDEDIARKEGVSRTTVGRWRDKLGLSANGVSSPKVRKKISEHRKGRGTKLYKKGCPEYEKSVTEAIRRRRAEAAQMKKEEC